MINTTTGGRMRELDAALHSLNTPPLTAWALDHFREVALRQINADGSIDATAARRILNEAPGMCPPEVLESIRVTCDRSGIRATKADNHVG